MSWQTDFKLVIEPDPAPISPWTVQEIPAYQTDENLKKQFGIELAKSINAFEAGCKVFGEETNKALWASFNWLSDPLVIASKDIYLKTVALSTPLLDRQQLAAKVLELADEKILNRNGVLVPIVEAKDRIAALKLYSDIAGYTGKVEIDNSTIHNTLTEIKIKLVKAEEKLPVTIDNAPNKNVKSEVLNDKSPISLKLVKAG